MADGIWIKIASFRVLPILTEFQKRLLGVSTKLPFDGLLNGVFPRPLVLVKHDDEVGVCTPCQYVVETDFVRTELSLTTLVQQLRQENRRQNKFKFHFYKTLSRDSVTVPIFLLIFVRYTSSPCRWTLITQMSLKFVSWGPICWHWLSLYLNQC